MSDAYSKILTQMLSALREKNNESWGKYFKAEKTTYLDAYRYAEKVGASASEILEKIPQLIEEGEITQNEGGGIVAEVMKQSSSSVSRFSAYAQQNINNQLGADLKVLEADVDAINERIKNLAIKYCDAEKLEDVDFLLSKRTQKVFNKSTVVDTQKQNASFLDRAGFDVYITRIADANCCDWCDSLAGTYRRSNVPDDIWKFHRDCPCYIEYTSGKTRTRVAMRTDSEGRLRKITSER